MMSSTSISNLKTAEEQASAVRSCVHDSRACRGFTLAETLLALAILVLLTGIVAMGVPVAFRTYTQMVNKSEAQVLLTTATNELRDELGLTQYVVTNNGLNEDGKVIAYVSPDGYWAQVAIRKSADGREDLVRLLYLSDVFMSDSLRDAASVNEGFAVYNDDGKPLVEALAAVTATKSLNMSADVNGPVRFNEGIEDDGASYNNASIELKKGVFIVEGLKVTDSSTPRATLASIGDEDNYYIQATMLEDL